MIGLDRRPALSRRVLAPLAAAAALLASACQGRGPGVEVTLTLDPGSPNVALSRLTVISGGDKYEFPGGDVPFAVERDRVTAPHS